MNFRNFHPETLEFEPFSANPNQTSYKSRKPKNPVNIQLPASYLPFGLSEPNATHNIAKHSLPIAIGGPNATPLQRECLAKFEEFDEWLAKYASEHSQDFFGAKTKSVEVCKELMNTTVKLDKNPEKAAKYGPRLSPEVKHSMEGGFYNIECRDTDGSIMSPLDIKRQSRGYVTIELTGLYSVSGKAFGASWVVRAVRITQHAANEAPPIALDMYGDCPPELEAALLALPIPGESLVVNEYEKRERQEEEPAPASQPAPKKAKGTKK